MARKQQCAGIVGGAKNPNKGKPCRNWAISGSEYCGVHGGSVKIATATAADLQNRCVHKANSTGERCKKPAIRGGTVCKSHGGAAAHVAKKARERLLELSEPAVVQLNRILTAQGTSDSDRLRAIQMVLDRTGLGPGVTVEHEVRPWEITMQHVFKQSTDVGIDRSLPPQLQAEIEAMPSRQYEDIEDAEVIEDEHPRDRLPQIIPPTSRGARATVRVGSAEPPRRKR